MRGRWFASGRKPDGKNIQHAPHSGNSYRVENGIRATIRSELYQPLAMRVTRGKQGRRKQEP
jgi:hypothetical protein